MSTTPAAAHSHSAGRHPGWLVLTASERGASHFATMLPNQDAVATERAGARGVVAAVADGHGHPRHLRSARGSKLAVRIGCQVAQALADRLEASPAILAEQGPPATVSTAQELIKLAQEFFVPTVVSRWRDAVLADVNADPFTQAEQAQRRAGDDATIAYGSTLLVCMELRDWLIMAQIGDGDVVGVRADGHGLEPVPADPHLDGLVTTSLCGSDPMADFRVAALDASLNDLVAMLLATDGFGNAQLVEDWPSAFSEDLALMLRDKDVNWLASQLPSWAERCASAEGSADDTTLALLISPAVASARTVTGAGSEETTIPAVPHDDTVPIYPLTEPRSGDPAAVRELAHGPAREPVILERSSPRRQADLPGSEPAGPGDSESSDARAGDFEAGDEPPTRPLRRDRSGGR